MKTKTKTPTHPRRAHNGRLKPKVAGRNAKNQSAKLKRWCFYHQSYKPCGHNGGVLTENGWQWKKGSNGESVR